jgi:hypothetical protein
MAHDQVPSIGYAMDFVGEGVNAQDLIEMGKSKFGGTENLGKNMDVVGLGT